MCGTTVIRRAAGEWSRGVFAPLPTFDARATDTVDHLRHQPRCIGVSRRRECFMQNIVCVHHPPRSPDTLTERNANRLRGKT